MSRTFVRNQLQKSKKWRDYALDKKDFINKGTIFSSPIKKGISNSRKNVISAPLSSDEKRKIIQAEMENLLDPDKSKHIPAQIDKMKKVFGFKSSAEAKKVREMVFPGGLSNKVKKELEKKLGVTDANIFPEYRKMAETGKITKEGMNKLIKRVEARKQLNAWLGRSANDQINEKGGGLAGSLIEGRKGKAALNNAERTEDNVRITHKQIGVQGQQYGISALMHQPPAAADNYNAGGSASAIEQGSVGAADIGSGVGVINRAPAASRPGMASPGTRLPFSSGSADGYFGKNIPSGGANRGGIGLGPNRNPGLRNNLPLAGLNLKK
jgi:hypothetical protein